MRILITQWTLRPEKTVRAYFCIKSAQFPAVETEQYQLTRLVPSLYHCRPRCPQRFCSRQRGL